MRIIFATCSPSEAEPLLTTLLEERLIACGNALPGVRSHYWWQGEICRDEEVVLLMETSQERAPSAMARLKELHSYDVPKIVLLDPEACDADYAQWLAASLERPS